MMMRSARGSVATWEIDPPTPPPELDSGSPVAYVVLRAKGLPVGRLVLEPPYPEDPADWSRLASNAARVGLRCLDPDTPGVPAREVAVVVATRNRPDDLDACLSALRRLEAGPGEIIVADSASTDPIEVANIARRHDALLVRLHRPGLSLARNAGAGRASCPFVAFLDDDCRVDPAYLGGLARGFETREVWAVTGQLVPSELDTDAQRLFLRYAHMDRRGFEPRRFEASRAESRHWPLDAWRMGSGGNLAVRRDIFQRLGGFSTSLGLGTPALGGEDLFLLWSVIRAGGQVVYRPDAMAWHRHHRDLRSLRHVMFGYGAGHRAYLRAAARAGATSIRLLDYRLSFWVDRAKRFVRASTGLWNVPADLVIREAAGHLSGGWRARRAEREAT